VHAGASPTFALSVGSTLLLGLFVTEPEFGLVVLVGSTSTAEVSSPEDRREQ
jgi:hypothetical protein